MSTSDRPYPPDFFRRIDESDDELFYREARFVAHIDDATIGALTQLYRDMIAPDSRVLDLTWLSHLPPEVAYERVAGLGMNREELAANPRLDDFAVHNLNRDPELPYDDEQFDVVVNAISVQYLTRPREVFASVRRVLRPGGVYVVAVSHRLFPEKAVAGWQVLSPKDRVSLVGSYFALTPGWEEPRVLDRSPEGADPLWAIFSRRVDEGGGS